MGHRLERVASSFVRGRQHPEMRDSRGPESESEQRGGLPAKKSQWEGIKHKPGEVNLGSRKKAKLLTHTGTSAGQPGCWGERGCPEGDPGVDSLGHPKGIWKVGVEMENQIHASKAARVTTAKM